MVAGNRPQRGDKRLPRVGDSLPCGGQSGFRDLAARVFRREAYAVTPKLVKWNGKSWQEVP